MPSKNKLKNLRKQAAQRQDWRCCYCQLPMWDARPQEFIVRYGISPGLAKRFHCTRRQPPKRVFLISLFSNVLPSFRILV